MLPKSVISYRETDLTQDELVEIVKQKICANCKHVFFHEEYTGQIKAYCDLAKRRPPSGDMTSYDIWDYYDPNKFKEQFLDFEIWKRNTNVALNGTCDYFDGAKA